MTKKDKRDGCRELNSMKRRTFMGISAAAATAVGLPSWFPQVTFSNSSNSYCEPECALIKLFGRGGWDGLSFCIPYADPLYSTIRPLSGTIGFDAPGGLASRACLDLDGFFGWPQAMQSAYDYIWNTNLVPNNNLAIVNTIGYPNNHSFSHFIGQHQIEVGIPEPSPSQDTGWIGRYLEERTLADGCPNPVVRGYGFSVAKQQALVGAPNCIASLDPADYNLGGHECTIDERLTLLQDLYVAEGIFDNVAENTVASIDELKQVPFATYTASGVGNSYPATKTGNAFKAIAAMIDCGVAVESFAVDLGGWDTHTDQDPHNLAGGKMYNIMVELSDALKAFYVDMLAKGHLKWVIFAMSEFGRTAPENGNFGTDHAMGNCMFLVGPSVNGGVYGLDAVGNPGWVGLNNLQGGGDDLPITLDFRNVAAEMFEKCMGHTDFSNIFPDLINPSDSYLGIFP